MSERLSIRIGGYDLDIIADPQLLRAGIMAEIDTMHLMIRVVPDLPEPIFLHVLLHESIHGILENAGFREHDEQMIDAIANGLVQIFRDNEWLVKCISGNGYIARENEVDEQQPL